ncbi:GH15 family glucan-1,4-alpha-glucosidase [Arthrobacter ginsengisoli]|uniref:GH15 family glucan-1,4-alpha-glucosidase n=1 Tax=Arthrobacter ginsengisoli TaxID=1356565 RepID=A0ABU1U7H7_9MICC|nr:glycoside hydrolase family 15 protein [Arthrobacter ginsengisoli]MDR7081131.1 GH15 family glucan-1,4-alpha-glucosidase [Arthrobacter ginsengisoli]
MSSEPIGSYALLSDCSSAVLVSSSGSVDWLCFPRFDSPSVFGRLLGPAAGFWSIRPVGAHTSTRRYFGPTMVLETTHTTADGSVTVTDALVLGDGRRGHDLGADSPGTLLRQVSGTAGTVELDIIFCPRPDYGLTRPQLRKFDGGLLATAGSQLLALSSPVAFELEEGTARARLTLHAGDISGFALHHQPAPSGGGSDWSQADITRRLADTVQGWTSWAEMHQHYQGPWQELVAGSGRILQALTYYPTGAFVAAPTTSLPEVAGGTRNWDYRYTWIRDASMTLQALWVAACPDEAGKFFQFLATAAARQLAGGEELQIMFGVGGERELPERELVHLPGWRASSPVRVGNGAWNQRQLDVYGELLDAAATLPKYLAGLSPDTRLFLADAADAAAARWRSADHGIWEVRGEPRHYLHSKLMCWVAVDRAIGLAGILRTPERVPHWAEAREQIAASIRTEGWSPAANAYTQAYGSDDLDASALMLAIVGFLPPEDPGMRATIAAIEQRLTDPRGLVYRYRARDGFAGEEGTFLLCTFWLAQALALAGETQRARDVFERAAGFATDLGLLAEEIATDSSELLGNFPQAFSHIGLVNAAWAIRLAEEPGNGIGRRSARPEPGGTPPSS